MRPLTSLEVPITIFCLQLLLSSALSEKTQQVQFEPIESINQLQNIYPDLVSEFWTTINTDLPELASVRSLLIKGDTTEAFARLIAHFKQEQRIWVVNSLDKMPTEEISGISSALLSDSVSIHKVKERIPLTPSGTWKWSHLGPNDDAEFAYSLNAQSYLPALFFAYQETQDENYVAIFNRIIQDWVLQHPLPEGHDSIYLVLNEVGGLDYRDIGEVEWRTLDTGRRLGASWPQLFYAFIDHDAFFPATKLLMLNSMAIQANYLRKYHKSNHNWTTMEMNGLALVGLAFPEFRDAGEWAEYALKTMTEEINRQVYPDGVQTELSSKTQWVALRRFESLANNFRRAGQEINKSYLRRIEEMYNYLAYCMRPDGHQPLNNDADREDLRPRVLAAAETYRRSDWKYIATSGLIGTKPSKGPSLTFPWAGISIFRTSWSGDSDWTFFDIGPYGTGHQHRDMLHISIAAFGQDLLVDGGRYTHRDYFSFDPTIWRGYFRSSHSHNTILINGHGQKAGPLVGENEKIEGVDYLHTPELDFAQGTFCYGYEQQEGEMLHTRSVLYLKNHLWLVVDKVDVEKPSEIQVLWHLHPDMSFSLVDQVLKSQIGDSIYFSIFPLSDFDWSSKAIIGQESPHIQGWYSPSYDEKIANPAIIYYTQDQSSATFCWLMLASDKGQHDPDPIFTKNANFLNINYRYEGLDNEIEFPLSFRPQQINLSSQ